MICHVPLSLRSKPPTCKLIQTQLVSALELLGALLSLCMMFVHFTSAARRAASSGAARVHCFHRRLGGSESDKDRAPQPGSRFVSSVRACAQCYSCRIRDKMAVRPPSLFPLSPGAGAFPFSLQDLSVGACLSKSE